MEFQTQRSPAGGFRFSVSNPPVVGTRLQLTDGRAVTYQGLGIAGMLSVLDAQGSEPLVFPHQVAEAPQ